MKVPYNTNMFKTDFCSFTVENENNRFKVTVRHKSSVKEFKFKRILNKKTINEDDFELKSQILSSLTHSMPSYPIDYKWIGELEGGSFIWFLPGESQPNQMTALKSIVWLTTGQQIPLEAKYSQIVEILFNKNMKQSLEKFLEKLQRKYSFKGWISIVGSFLCIAIGAAFLLWGWHQPVEQLVSVPYILGENITSAEKILKEKNLDIKIVDTYGNRDLVVFYQQPGEGSLVEPSSLVKIKLKPRLQ